MHRTYILFASLAFILLNACTHNIQMSPPLDQIRIVDTQKKINNNVGYYISSKDRNEVIIASGGMGDNVSYRPYADTEAALNTALSKVFDRVYSVKSLEDKTYIQEKDIKYIFIPTIITHTRSEDALTWVPTHFTVQLSCVAINTQGKQVWATKVKSDGLASFSEYSSGNFSLSAKRASAKAFISLMHEISKAEEF